MKHIFLLILLSVTAVSYSQYSSTPIMLSLPMDADTIEEDEPTFVWQTTLSNLQNDPRLNVQLAVVQVQEGQTPAEAIAENNPVFLRQNLLSSSLNYSSIDHELQEGVWYAWQVVLFYNGVQVQQSEVSKFIKAESVVPVPSYIALRTKADNSIYELSGDKLYVTTDESGDFQLQGTISGKHSGKQPIQFVEVGAGNANESVQRNESRYFSCDLSELDLKKGTYRIEWEPTTSKHFILLIKKQ